MLSAEERDGLQGFEIAKKLHDKRVHAIKALKHRYAADESKETPPDPAH
jgi:hypothetical protein